MAWSSDSDSNPRVQPLWKYVKQEDGSINIQVGDALHGPVLQLECLLTFLLLSFQIFFQQQ